VLSPFGALTRTHLRAEHQARELLLICIEDFLQKGAAMLRKLKSGEYRLYSRKIDPRTGKRRNLGTFDTREQAEKHERAVQFFKRRG
jgi:hypothetical protein